MYTLRKESILEFTNLSRDAFHCPKYRRIYLRKNAFALSKIRRNEDFPVSPKNNMQLFICSVCWNKGTKPKAFHGFKILTLTVLHSLYEKHRTRATL